MNYPVVSIICICYNHSRFIRDAVDSVLAQDYPNVQLIIADDHSTDNSVEIIRSIVSHNPEIIFVENKQNIGNCRTFNKAFKRSDGEFVIDFSADDILMPQRIRAGVEALQTKGPEYGVHYSDAVIINEDGVAMGIYSQVTKTVRKLSVMPEGDVFSTIVERYFICPPTLMARREVFESLGGYDESLDYEDFDFLVRASRIFNFCYSPDLLVKRRIVKGSKSDRQYKNNRPYYLSTLRVCEKALQMVASKGEKNALNKRMRYECRQAIRVGEKEIATGYIRLMRQNKLNNIERLFYKTVVSLLAKTLLLRMVI